MDIASFCSYKELEWHGCYGSGAKYQKYQIPESVKHPAKMSFGLLERIFKHLESLNLLTPDSVVIDFMAGTGRTGTMAALRRYRTISVELEPHFVEMIIGYDCDGKTISDFRIEPCVCKSETLHRPHTIRTGLFEVECSGNPRIIPVCRCGTKVHHKKHHIPGNRELIEQATGRKVRWDVIQGDARELSRLMNLTELVGVVSPPYFSQVAFQDKDFIKSIAEDKSQRYRDGRLKGHFATLEAIQRAAEKIMENYSMDPRNIGNLPDAPLVGIISPPYGACHIGDNQRCLSGQKTEEENRLIARSNESRDKYDYSKNPDNIGNLKDVPLVGIMSPPYTDTVTGDKNHSLEYDKKRIAYGVKFKRPDVVLSEKNLGHKALHGGYSINPDNIGNLKDIPLVGIMSPPYSEAQNGGGIVIEGYRGIHMHEQGKNQPAKVGRVCGYLKELHGSNPGNIGNFPDRPIVGITSPPYENQTYVSHSGCLDDYCKRTGRNPNSPSKISHKEGYGENSDNIGNQKDESYLSAMLKVYQQAYLSGISPLVVVTKNPTRNGALRRLDLDTVFLLQKSGYEIFDYHRAILFETHRQETLDGDSKAIHKGRISFFKRLSLEKGATAAQWEDVIFARIPGD